MELNCELIANSDVEHLQQIYTGYSLLHKDGFLNLTQTIPQEFLQYRSWTDYRFFNTKVVLNDEITICYDTHDWNWIDPEILRESDFYFKRSYDNQYISKLADKAKIFPLGLNYPVSSSELDFFKLQRSRFYQGKEKIKTIIKSLKFAEALGQRGTIAQMLYLEALPDFNLEPKIIFMAKVWDPNRVESSTQKGEIEALNQTRADCIRVLRREFGSRFFGGLAHDDYSLRYFNDALIPNADLSNQRKYLEILKTFPICVTTVGLNGSNGWKLGEYVALSKAIISEPLAYNVPGDFACERNYLEFTTPEELVEAAGRLFEDHQLRVEMMANNYRYYRSYLRPDALILNSLAIVFRERPNLFRDV